MDVSFKAPMRLLLLLMMQLKALQASSLEGLRTSDHAGTWFPGTQGELQSLVDAMLAAAPAFPGRVKAVTVPHAAYMFSGKTAAVGFKQMAALNRSVQRVVLLGPWHRGGTGLMLPPEEYDRYGTPLGTVPLDTEGISSLQSSGLYDMAPANFEAEEHSIAVQIPFLGRVLPEGAVLVPIYVGMVADEDLALYADTLVPFFMDPGTVFVISTDWSHWGPRYGYMYLPDTVSSSMPLFERIKLMDMEAIDCVVGLDRECLEKHVSKTRNQICGYDALRLFLAIIDRVASSSGKKPEQVVSPALLMYSQSGNIRRPIQSSVGYAAIGFFDPQ